MVCQIIRKNVHVQTSVGSWGVGRVRGAPSPFCGPPRPPSSTRALTRPFLSGRGAGFAEHLPNPGEREAVRSRSGSEDGGAMTAGCRGPRACGLHHTFAQNLPSGLHAARLAEPGDQRVTSWASQRAMPVRSGLWSLSVAALCLPRGLAQGWGVEGS